MQINEKIALVNKCNLFQLQHLNIINSNYPIIWEMQRKKNRYI